GDRQEHQILKERAPDRQGMGRRVRNGLIMGATAIGVAQKEDEKQGIDEQDIFDGVVFFLAAITRRLFSRVLGADDASFGAVMGTRGASGAATGATPSGAAASSSEATTMAASPSDTPPHCAHTLLHPP